LLRGNVDFISSYLQTIFLQKRKNWYIRRTEKEKMIMGKSKYLFGCASLVAAMALPATTKASIQISLVPDASATATANGNSDVTISGQNVTITNVGDKVVMDIFSSSTNSDGNSANDGFSAIKAAFSSVMSQLGGLQGTFNGGSGAPQVTFNTSSPSFINASTSGVGAEFDQTDNGTFVTGGDPLTNTAQQSTSSGGTVSEFSTGSAPTWGNGVNQAAVPSTTVAGSNPLKLLLGTITWTDSTLGAVSTFASVNGAGQTGLGGTAGNKAIATYYQDQTPGNGSPTKTNDSSGTVSATDFSSGSAVLISGPVPEPTSLGLIGLGVTVLGARARRRSVKA